jgi:hypothetical protein
MLFDTANLDQNLLLNSWFQGLYLILLHLFDFFFPIDPLCLCLENDPYIFLALPSLLEVKTIEFGFMTIYLEVFQRKHHHHIGLVGIDFLYC